MPATMKNVRKKLFVDPQVQGQLVGRVCLYWVMCLLTVTFMVICYRILTGPARPFVWHFEELRVYLGPALVASLLILPLVVVDVIRVSNRFAGPLVRLRRSLRAAAKGEPVEPIRFRQGDFWQEFADEFNALLQRVKTLEEKATSGEARIQPSHSESVEPPVPPVNLLSVPETTVASAPLPQPADFG
ncbi:hypothetical protein [Thermogutta sp.]|jgi:hypothetical protein|uniref:hypothetical protein n=1 Tax=Thermogutta sp. TaxID=1962930 RepID=UPI0032203FA2